MSDSIEPEIYVKLNLTFRALRVINNRIIPTNWDITVDVIYDETPPQDQKLNQDIEVRGALAKIRYWFNNIIDGSILFNRNNTWAVNAFTSLEGSQTLDNVLVLLPFDPTDEILAQVFQSKMNALAGNHITFGAIDIASDDTEGLSFLFTGISELNLPSMDEWIGERTYFSKPWWCRDDGSTLDVVPNEDNDLNDVPEFAISLDFLVERFRPKDMPKAQIIRAEFRPQVIKGGQ